MKSSLPGLDAPPAVAPLPPGPKPAKLRRAPAEAAAGTGDAGAAEAPAPAAPRRSDNQDLLDQIRKATGSDPTKQIINETAHFGNGNTRKRPLEYVSLAERLRTGSQPVANYVLSNSKFDRFFL